MLGHSAGGFVGLHLALRHAVAVGGLVLCNTTPTLVPFPDDDPPPGLAERATPEALEVAGRMFGGDFSPGWDRFISLVAPYYAAPNHMDVPQRVLEISAFAPEIAQHFFTSLAQTYDVRPRLGEIRVPTLVVVGRHDWVCPPVAGRLLATSSAGAPLVELADAGHFTFAEEPDRFQAAVQSFLAMWPSDRGSAARSGAA